MPGCGEKGDRRAEYRRRKEQEAKWLLGPPPKKRKWPLRVIQRPAAILRCQGHPLQL